MLGDNPLRNDVAARMRVEDQLRLLIEATTDYAIFLLDPDGCIATWNPGAERLKRYKPHEIIGEHFSRFYPEDAVDRGWPAHELEVARHEGRFEDEGWRIRKDGSRFWASVVITAVRDDAGELLGFGKITRDLTERKRAEENAVRHAEEASAHRALEERTKLIQSQREQLRVTLASIGDGVIATDLAARVTFMNSVAVNLTGWTEEEAYSRSLEDIFRIINEETRASVANPALRALAEGTIVGLANHTLLIAKDGTERPIADSAAPIRDEHNKITGSVLVFRDVSKERRAERLRNARLAATQHLNGASTIEDAARGVLKNICDSLEWDVGFYWAVDESGESLVCRQSWHRHGVDVQEFEEASCSRRFVKGQGLPGRIWQGGACFWLADLANDNNFPRLPSALKYGLQSAFGCPIDVDNQILGVIEFFSGRREEADHDLLEMMTTIAGSFGQFIERKSAEESVKESEARLAVELNAISRLHALSTRLLGSTNLESALDDILLEVIHASHADFGNIQLYDERERALKIAVHKGFGSDFLEHFEAVRLDEGSCCAQAMERGEAVIIEDVNLDPTYDKHRDIAKSAGYRAVQSTPIKSRNGRILGMLSTHYEQVYRPSERDLRLIELHSRHAADLIERYEMESALRRSEGRFRELANSTPQIVWSAGPDGQIDYLNHRWTDYTGLPATVGNDGWKQILHPDDAGEAGELWSDCIRSGTPFDMEVRLLNPEEGAYRWHLIRTVATRDDHGNVSRWFGTATDVQEQKRSQETSRYLAEASAALAAVVDYESTLQKVANLAVPYFADWSAVDVLEGGKLRRLAVSHQDAAKLELAHELSRRYPVNLAEDDGVAGVLRTGEPLIVADITDEMLIAGAKDEKHLEMIRLLGLKSFICVPLVIAGEPFGVLTFATAESGRKYSDADLTVAVDLANRASVAVQNTKLYGALKDNDRRKDEFLATLAHELRNPLAPIRNGLNILRMSRDNGAATQIHEMMERQVAHMVRLVDDLLELSRISRGKIELKKERISLATILEHAIETSRPLIEAGAHRLTFPDSARNFRVEGDLIRLSQVFANLLTNAAKYTEKGGEIKISVSPKDDDVLVNIRDNGIGIPPDMLSRIFDMFAQVNNPLRRSQDGLGIGLNLVQTLVQMHGGSVKARSEGIGRGSEFIVRLPISGRQHGDESSVNGDNAAQFATVRRILCVDDNKDSADSLAMMLKLLGADVHTAYDGPSALDAIKICRPAIVLMDLGMPGMDGFEAARAIRQNPEHAGVVLVAMTGWGQDNDRRRSREAGFDHHMVKPVDLNALQALLATCEKAF